MPWFRTHRVTLWPVLRVPYLTVAFCVCLATGASLAPSLAPPAWAAASTTACVNTFDYAMQYTAYGYPVDHYHTGKCSLQSGYAGWAGINGQIATPSSTARLGNANYDFN